MNWCFKCGVSSEKELLYDALADKGIVKACKKCAFEENLPIIKKPSQPAPLPKPIIPRNLNAELSKNSKSMYQRLSKLSGVKLEERKTEEEKEILRRQEQSLKELANKNFREKMREKPANTSEFIENFNWAIMRARRSRRLTPEQLGKAIGESDALIRMAEQGVLRDDPRVVKKLESYLGIKIYKKGSELADFQKTNQELSFDPITTKSVTISDLKQIGRRDSRNDVDFSGIGTNIRERGDEVELSNEEIDELLFKDQ